MSSAFAPAPCLTGMSSLQRAAQMISRWFQAQESPTELISLVVRLQLPNLRPQLPVYVGRIAPDAARRQPELEFPGGQVQYSLWHQPGGSEARCEPGRPSPYRWPP
jgi:hypothetical protein